MMAQRAMRSQECTTGLLQPRPVTQHARQMLAARSSVHLQNFGIPCRQMRLVCTVQPLHPVLPAAEKHVAPAL